ncbi:MAG TPA: HAD family phosphatase, partial [Ruminococcus sp.]|nr:HAD family phosphatase [Ruminococcus sp.]
MKDIKLKGAIFDMDGVIIDTEKLYLRFWKEAAAEFGYDMRDEHVFAVRSMARKYSIPKLKSMLGQDFPTEEVRSRRTELMNEFISKSGIETKKGLFRLLNHLRDSGVKIAVATATQRERTLSYLSRIGALEFFDAVICGDMVTTGKPAPDIYLSAAGELGLPPETCAAFEDSPNGLISAHTAGCYTVMVPDLTQPDEAVLPYIDKVINDLGEAVDLFGEVLS